jgi:hypothetical protein
VSPDANSAQVTIKRKRVWTGSLLAWSVWLDGKEEGKLPVGRSLTISTSPGLHSITVRQPILGKVSGEPFVFSARAGERVELVTKAAISGEAKVWHRNHPAGDSPTVLLPVRPEPRPRPIPLAPTTSTIIEGTRYEVHLGKDTRVIDNSRSISSTIWGQRITRKWTRTYSLDAERHRVIRGAAGFDFHLLTLKAEAERTLKNIYSVTSEEREVFEQQVTLNVAAHTRSEVSFFWKEIRQRGTVRLSGTGFEVELPYEAVVGLAFDQEQVDAQ